MRVRGRRDRCHGDAPSRIGRVQCAAFWRSADGGRTGPAPREAAGAQRRMAGGGYFASRCKAGDHWSARGLWVGRSPAAENSRRPPLRARPACRPIALLKAAGAAAFREGRIAANRYDRRSRSHDRIVIRLGRRASHAGIAAHLPGQVARARPREAHRCRGGANPR